MEDKMKGLIAVILACAMEAYKCTCYVMKSDRIEVNKYS